MSILSTHVLDATTGTPAAGVEVMLSSAGREVARSRTDDDGRITEFPCPTLGPGVYTLTFATGDYFALRRVDTFYPEVVITFRIPEQSLDGASDENRKYHVPLLLSPYSYSTYRGS